ncbi:uncharacterized protein V6R79_025050 [Siganus canaliculatus]
MQPCSLRGGAQRLQENICSRHDEVKKIFCRSDQQIICYLCSMEEHRGHDTVTAAAERTERQRELEGSRHNIQQRIQDRQKELKLLQKEVEDISRSADKTVEDSKEIFTQLIRVMEQRRRDVEQQARVGDLGSVRTRDQSLRGSGGGRLGLRVGAQRSHDGGGTQNSGWISASGGPATKELFDHHCNFSPRDWRAHPWSPGPATEAVSVSMTSGVKQIICYLCSMEEHRGHDTVTAAAERTERQRELEGSRHNIQQRIQDRQKELKLLQQEVEDISRSADKTVEDSQEIFTQLISVMEQRRRDVEQQVRSQQEAEVSRVKELEEKLEQEIRELERKDAELKKLSDTEDHSQFLQDYPSLSGLSGSTHSPSINIRPLRHFEDVTAAVSKLRDQLQELLRDTWTNISLAVTEPDVLLSGPEPKSRAGFLKYSCEITLDPNTVNRYLILSEGNRKVTFTSEEQCYPDHPDRFTVYPQVLSRESLTGRCYWELEWSGSRVDVAVTYKNISRTGRESWFGSSDKSWMLRCLTNSFVFYHNKTKTPVSGPGSSRLGVYLDRGAGLLSFYSISGTMTLLHRVQTTFTEPLHVGIYVFYRDSTAEFCEVKQAEKFH